MRRLVILPLAMVFMAAAATTCACEPTGSTRCDNLAAAFPARAIIESNHYRVDCSPGFSSWNGERYVSGWNDPSTHTVWIWPDRIRVFVNSGSNDAMLLKTFWHEAGHTTGIGDGCANEIKADQYAYKHMKPAEREGIGFLAAC